MRIYTMKATFGKLEQKTLTLTPGLNIIEAPNEWGKSTWCAFLISMLYGIDTRAKSTRSQLADKERFLPWSGSPMEGSIDLNWKGRDITIQRRTKGRVPLGEFRAFETHTGLEVPELSAQNCGQLLLGVEKDVFTRAGFLRFSDLPVTEDEQLRRRLNALVTTGDESGSAQLLEQKLKELKNRCRYNRTGLLPQAREQKEQLERKLQEHQSLTHRIRQLQERISALEQHIARLENHKAALRYAFAQNSALQLREAGEATAQAQLQLQTLQDQIDILPTREDAMKNIRQLTQLQQELDAIHMEEQMLPSTAFSSEPPKGFADCPACEAVLQVRKHMTELEALRPKKKLLPPLLLILGVLFLIFSPFLFSQDRNDWGLLCAGSGAISVFSAFALIGRNRHRLSKYRAKQAELSQQYGSSDPLQWLESAQAYANSRTEYIPEEDDYAIERRELQMRKETLVRQSMAASNAKGLTGALEYWNDILKLWDEYADARCGYRQSQKQLATVQSLATNAPPPNREDPLTYSEDETNHLISDARQEVKQLLSQLGLFRGQMDSLGSRDEMERDNRALEQRILQLEQTYAALDLALKALSQASSQLQRRFAPRITQSAQEILSQLTNGRYTRLTLSQDFSLQVSAENENTLRSRHWRSDGTVDQLYLALRLAVARELTADAPLILDDALVRFDDTRLKAALQILKTEALNKQVILFTCQGREQNLLETLK